MHFGKRAHQTCVTPTSYCMRFEISLVAFDLEKTILDLIYLWNINNMDDRKIVQNISEFVEHVSKEKIVEYSKYYPENNRNLLERVL